MMFVDINKSFITVKKYSAAFSCLSTEHECDGQNWPYSTEGTVGLRRYDLILMLN